MLFISFIYDFHSYYFFKNNLYIYYKNLQYNALFFLNTDYRLFMWGNIILEATYNINFNFGFPDNSSDMLLNLTHWQY